MTENSIEPKKYSLLISIVLSILAGGGAGFGAVTYIPKDAYQKEYCRSERMHLELSKEYWDFKARILREKIATVEKKNGFQAVVISYNSELENANRNKEANAVSLSSLNEKNICRGLTE